MSPCAERQTELADHNTDVMGLEARPSKHYSHHMLAVCAETGDVIMLNVFFNHLQSGHINPIIIKSCWGEINVLYKEKNSGRACGECPDRHSMTHSGPPTGESGKAGCGSQSCGPSSAPLFPLVP